MEDNQTSKASLALSDIARVNKNFNLDQFDTWLSMHSLPKGVFADIGIDCIYLVFSPKRIDGMFEKYFKCQSFTNPISLYQQKDNFIHELNATLYHFIQLAKDQWFIIDCEIEKSVEVEEITEGFPL